jgi:hypothetical protein
MAEAPQPRVIVVTDWKRCSRGVLWGPELAKVTPNVRQVPLADWLTGQGGENPASLIQALEASDVLILNFDCINGDPAFGSDVAQDWFRYRRPEIFQWVAEGGILIVEGQAMLAVPAQAAYDALLGPGELRVSGPSEKFMPWLEQKRTGGTCHVTAQARKHGFFPGSNLLHCITDSAMDHRFPGRAGFMLSLANRKYDWRMLYRGWFPRVPTFRRRFNWVPLIKTEGERFNHAVLLAARHGKGVMFASTMWLAGTGQTPIIQRLVEWNPAATPLQTRGRAFPIFDKALSAAISGLAAWGTSRLGFTANWRPGMQALSIVLLWAGYFLGVLAVKFVYRTVLEFIGL